MPDYFLDLELNNITYGERELNLKEFECCIFNHCDFSQCNFIGVVFIDCTFNDCILSGAKINHVALRTVLFNRCKIEEVNFAMCDKLIFEVHFKECIMDFSKFYTLKIKGTTFLDCSIIAVDFMNTDLTEVVFDNCDLYRSEFSKANLSKANLKTSYNYTIDPTKTKIKKATFALENLKGLLFKHDIIVS
jgi:uncharacterized protein YjbI with pentapeptide repeats